MNRIIFLLSILSILSSCSSGETKSSAPTTVKDSVVHNSVMRDTVVFTIEPIDEMYYCKQTQGLGYCVGMKEMPNSQDLLPEEIEKLMEAHKDIISANGDELIVKTKVGDIKFKNTPEDSEEGYIEYKLRKVDGNFVVLFVGYFESFEFMVINLETGKSFKTWGQPVFNKTKTLAIAGNYDLVAQFTNNGIQLFGQDSTGWDMIMQKSLDDWGPMDMYWLNDSVILSKKYILDETDSVDGTKTEFVKIMLKKEKVN